MTENNTKAQKTKKRRARFAIVVSRFNDFVTGKLLDGCLDELNKNGVAQKDISVVRVPGAFEIPVTAQKLAKKKTVDAVICLGAVIRGETLHFELVAEGAALGIMQASLNTGKPIIFEILATDTIALAEARAKKKGINKGRDAAQAALEMVEVLGSI